MQFDLELEILKNCQKEVFLKKLVLVFHTGPLHQLIDSGETLGNEIIILDINQISGILLGLVFEDFPYSAHNVEIRDIT